MTQPRSLTQIIPAPGNIELYATDHDGSLYRRSQEQWESVPLPAELPPIVALLGFVEARSPLELVVAAETGDKTELWTLVLAGTEIARVQPTSATGSYRDPLEFLRSHHTPTCRADDEYCLTWTETDGRWFIDVATRRFGESRQPLIELDEAQLLDVAWADSDASSVFILAAGAPCVVPDSLESNAERHLEGLAAGRRG